MPVLKLGHAELSAFQFFDDAAFKSGVVAWLS